jgi:hypothetical protein
MSRQSNPWKVIHSQDSQHLTIWQVTRMVRGRKEMGYFKIPKRNSYRHIGPLLANEMICNKLAKVLGLPVAKTQFMHIRGRLGVLSMAKPQGRLQRWREYAKSREKPFKDMSHSRRLDKTFVFDIWVCNIDRNDKNIIVYRNGMKYDFYLIDHELSLLGAVRYENKPWYSGYWDNVRGYTRGYKPALLPYMKSRSELKPYVRFIQHLPVKTIDAVVDRVPSIMMSRKDKVLTKKILLRRRKRLHDIVQRCIR